MAVAHRSHLGVNGGRKTGLMLTGGLAALITSLWRRGVPVIGWADLEAGVALLVEGGALALVPRARLGERADLVAEDLVFRLPRRSVFEAPVDPEHLPRFTARELAWLQFVRWLRQRPARCRTEDADRQRLQARTGA